MGRDLRRREMPTNIDVVMDRLQCHHTTELGHDEFYYWLAAVVRDANGVAVGNPTGLKGPGAAQGADADNGTAWDMNDDGSDLSDRHLNAVLTSLTLQPNQTATIGLVFMESDNTKTAAQVTQASGAIAGAIVGFAGGGPIGGVIGAVVGALAGFLPVNQDDHLGAASFRVECHADGSAWLPAEGYWTPNTQVWAQSQDGVPPYSTDLHLFGDGSNYIATVRLDGVTKQAGSAVDGFTQSSNQEVLGLYGKAARMDALEHIQDPQERTAAFETMMQKREVALV
jgi:hypothetical protein